MRTTLPADSKDLHFLAGGGEMGARMRELDWTHTPLGPVDAWPQSLKTIVRVMLDSRYAMWMLWGSDLTFFCNDAYLPTVGMKRDWVLGARSDKVWEEIWPEIGPRIERVLEEGRATWDEGLPLFLERYGFAEETYHTFSYSPIYDDDNRIAGMLCVVTEVTDRVIGERRLRVLRDLAASPRAESTEAACRRLIDVLANNPLDVSFASLHLLDPGDKRCSLVHYVGDLPAQFRAAQFDLASGEAPRPMVDAIRSGTPRVVELAQREDAASASPLSDRPRLAIVLPVRQGSSTSIAVLVAGISPRRPLDDAYRGFFDLIVRQFAAAISDAQAYEAERARAEGLAEIDRSKTAFFSNVSHEFRTPLTLLLGPLEDALQNPARSLSGEALDSAHRNALRLLRLVNALLDFSRIESGRNRASFVRTDLAAVTRDLASVFRAAMDRAGLRYTVECESLPDAAYVDLDMWEKIVLNLLSNAFKYTFEGEIRVRLHAVEDRAELVVADTGTGIPAEALPELFNRFYRVPGASGRTHEGSGIGLSLVRELIGLHGGSITVESSVGQGSIFRIRIPLGSAHLPIAQVDDQRVRVTSLGSAQAFADEAQRWLPDCADLAAEASLPGSAAPVPPERPAPGVPIILLVDDNRDMRDYVTRLLRPRYTVVAAEDGQRALDLIDAGIRPDLVLSDVMMPVLDGFGLLRALRARPATGNVPVIFLSARAGEEAKIDGFESGADDYLIKPFSARELISRIDTHVRLSRLRRAATEHIKLSEERLRIATDEAGMGTWDLDLRNNEVQWSHSLYQLLGYTAPTDNGQFATYDLWRGCVHGADVDAAEAAFWKARDSQSLFSHEYRIRRADSGAVRWLRVLGRFLYDESGAAVRSVGVLFDDTERKAAEIALRLADQRKDVFLATLAHELRNPLAPISNAAQVLASPKLGPSQLQWAQNVIQRQVKHMAWLLDDLLDVARITQGKLELKKQRISLNSVVDSAVEVVRPLLTSKSHQLLVNLPAQPVTLDADPLRFSQILSNLLTNAAKYTDAGGRIILSGVLHAGTLSLSVKDNGIGIAPDSLHGIFVMFSQVEAAATRSEGGLGIGLALVRGLTELHGGSVEAKSAGIGAGSEFILHMPLGTQERRAVPETSQAPRSSAGRRILVADDNKDAADSLALLLDMAGHVVRVAHDGRAALSLANTFRPDAAFLDIGMPQLDGYGVAKALRQESWGAGIYLIALTGWGQEGDRQRAFDAGFDRHLTKPVDPDELHALLAARKGGSRIEQPHAS